MSLLLLRALQVLSVLLMAAIVLSSRMPTARTPLSMPLNAYLPPVPAHVQHVVATVLEAPAAEQVEQLPAEADKVEQQQRQHVADFGGLFRLTNKDRNEHEQNPCFSYKFYAPDFNAYLNGKPLSELFNHQDRHGFNQELPHN